MATDAVIAYAVQRLGDIVLQEPLFLLGVSDKVQQLRDELQRMRCFLSDAHAKTHTNESVRNWVAEITEAAYDAEDVLETYVLRVAPTRGRGVVGFLKSCSGVFDKTVTIHKVGSEIDAITARLSNIAVSLKTYGVKELHQASSSFQERQKEKRETFPHVVEQNLVGLESDVEELVKNMVDDKYNHFQVTSICGMGGVGKTTLARYIYNTKQVKEYFNHFAWACISQLCRRRYVWEGILLSLLSADSKDRVANLSDQDLAAQLHLFMTENKCLVILDDIWSTEAWDSLKDAFPCVSNSKILLTSRNREVTFHVSVERSTSFHQLRPLNNEESWNLFQKVAFPRVNYAELKIDTRMEELGQQMVKYCGGLPLAIKVLGSLLSKGYTLEKWQTIHENIKSYIIRGDAHGHSNQSPVSNVLSLSYHDLSPRLKQCFLYLGHFPEDYEIHVDKLITFWIAEGLVTSTQHSGERTWRMLEDTAETYLNELIERSLVLIKSTDFPNSKVKTVCMHDLMRDVCLLEGEKASYLQVVNAQSQEANEKVLFPSSTRESRRISVHLYHLKGDKAFSQNYIRNSRLRSLLFFSSVGDYFYANSWELYEPGFHKLKLLRVLDLEGVEFKRGKLPSGIGKLIHLRYLSLRDSNVTKLPSSLGNLTLLLTLDLFIDKGKVHIPDVIWKMENLKQLYLPFECDAKTKLHLGNLRNLHTLENFRVAFCDIKDVFRMTNLRNLYIDISSKSKHSLEVLSASIGDVLENLHSLQLSDVNRGSDMSVDVVKQMISSCTNLIKMTLTCRIDSLRHNLHLSQRISFINLLLCQIEEDPLPVLGTLPDLRLLLLNDCFFGKEMVCSAQGFPQLRLLILHKLYDLEDWVVEEGSMSNLSNLEIEKCPKLKMLPDGLRFITTLQEITIRSMPKEFKDKLLKGEEDFYKVQHVPSIQFHNCDD